MFGGWPDPGTMLAAGQILTDEATVAFWEAEADRCREEAANHKHVLSGTWTASEAAIRFLAGKLHSEFHTKAQQAIRDLFYWQLLEISLIEINWSLVAAWILNDLPEECYMDSFQEGKKFCLPSAK